MTRPTMPPRDGIDGLLDRLALDERDGPALPISDGAALELVRRARERCGPAPRTRRVRVPKWPLIGIGVVVASSAAAAALGELPRLLAWVAPSEAPAPSIPARASNAQKTETPRAQPEPPAPESAAPAAVADADAERTPAARATSMREARHAWPSRAQDTKGELRRGLEAADARDSAPAADRLGVANRARAERRYGEALDTYRDIIASYPQTRQAQIAAVAAGEIELGRGNARAAEPLFQRVPHDAEVGAEALFGLVEAYRTDARVVEERGALDRFVQLYPSNPLAAVARRRLSQLDAGMKSSPASGSARAQKEEASRVSK